MADRFSHFFVAIGKSMCYNEHGVIICLKLKKHGIRKCAFIRSGREASATATATA